MRTPTAVRLVVRSLSSLVLVALAGLLVLVGLAGPAAAGGVRSADAEGSLCTGGKGVSVVVDPGALGGAVTQDCVQDGGGKVAADVFASAGVDLTPVGEFPGAACKVDGEPADAACQSMPPADAYWGLYLATGGTWDYAPKGVDQLRLQDGAFVAFAWQDSATSTPPSVEPAAATASESASSGTGADIRSSNSGDGTAESSVESNDSNDLSIYIPFIILGLLVVAVVVVLLRRRTDAGE
jgi:hypothetical protein